MQVAPATDNFTLKVDRDSLARALCQGPTLVGPKWPLTSCHREEAVRPTRHLLFRASRKRRRPYGARGDRASVPSVPPSAPWWAGLSRASGALIRRNPALSAVHRSGAPPALASSLCLRVSVVPNPLAKSEYRPIGSPHKPGMNMRSPANWMTATTCSSFSSGKCSSILSTEWPSCMLRNKSHSGRRVPRNAHTLPPAA